MIDDVSRYNYFCQFRSTIRSSRNNLIVGIDVAKDKHHAFFGTAYENIGSPIKGQVCFWLLAGI
ncbi:MAG: IS110 family transposase [Desulfobacterium sp.]|nr:IS110 family transposase [Desulfobacterium sp.]MBU3946803.1 IS110 family transposase [Pseudomonadota bacterium]